MTRNFYRGFARFRGIRTAEQRVDPAVGPLALFNRKI